ncbi:ExeA4 [Desulforapulum autotrophicum HRM2]|uniref:ExeA3 n=1 Tax=Desulforapulum autotrophicum (strain ATCC 43914 / DSM 3382 / VKM B-1955 / HRM2) TaxID=177437 RepID=C0QA20_DESAH|nr:AAA family ATPase [Desulforapulum autotrophicum]ACN16436.1 ExeA3 [Desulforapulum autotrophicum HRM2]ACN16738.1 ExeA4 [Desulforapulum autotrophicum HRM2]
MLSKTMDVTTPLPMGDFFGWKRHPFADTYIQRQLWMSDDDKRKSETIRRLLHHGKSTALYGPSGSGKTTLIHGLISDLDKNVYLPVLLPYAGHPRNGLTKVLAQALGVDIKGRGTPLITRIQQHIEALSGSTNPRHPVLIIDDAQRVEPDSLWDLCSLLFRTAKQTVAASLVLVGDENLARQLELYVMLPIRSRLTGIMKINTMNEYETRLFILSRLKNAEAPEDLFTEDAIDLIAAYTRGNRRGVMNTATVALEEAYYHNEKNVTAEILYNSDWFNESE